MYAMEVIAPCRLEGESVRFFVSAPGQHPSSSSVGFINQGNTTLLECRMEAIHIFSLVNRPVDTVHCSVSSGWSSRNISLEHPAVRLLRKSWDDFFSSCNSEFSMRLQVCAGNGVFVVRAALRGYLHAYRIFVVAFAPSCTIDPESCFCVRHYRATGDLASLCSGPGSAYPEFSVILRNCESRGLLDEPVYSSTFQEFLRLEGMYFRNFRARLRCGSHTENMRTRHLELYGDDPNSSCLQTNAQRHESLVRRLLTWFWDGTDIIDYNGHEEAVENLVEEALAEFPRNRLEFCLIFINMVRDVSLIASEIAIGIIAHGSAHIRIAAIGIPILQVVERFRRMGVYVIPRDTMHPSVWRIMGLRGSLFSILCLLYESAISCSLLVSGEAPSFLVHGLLGYVVLTDVSMLGENTIRFCLPLRGRIQGWLTVVSEEDISTERTENEEANRIGIIARLFRGIWDAGEGVTTVVVAASLAFGVATLSTPLSQGNDTESNTDSSSTQAGLGFLAAFTGVVAVSSIICNICQIRRMFRRSRRPAVSDAIPLLELAPTNSDRVRRRFRNTADADVREESPEERPPI